MELEHSFTVPVPKERAWDVLLDVERVAPCMPGATLDSVDGDDIRGRIKVKVGPISMTYVGTAEIVERDEKAGVVRLEASGKETRGAGTASASVRSLLEDRGQETHVTVLTTLNVTGKPAQFGRGVMNEVGGKLLNIFANNLADMLAQADDEVADEAGGEAAPKAEVTLEGLGLPPRVLASLRKAGIDAVDQLTAKTDDEVLAIDGIGPASADEIKAKLAEHGLAFTQVPAAQDKASADQAPAAAAPGGGSPAAANGVAASASKAGANGARTGTTTAAPPKSTSGPAPVHQDEALNLLRVAGLPVLKRSLPVLAGVTAVIIFSWRRKARRRSR